MDDQQIAGLVMWVPGSLAYLAAAAWVFVTWIRASERRHGKAEPVLSIPDPSAA
jgi:putative membrane protein